DRAKRSGRRGPYRQASPRRPGTALAPGLRAWEMCLHSTADQPGKGERTMSFPSWLRHLRSAPAPGRGQRHHRRRSSPRAATHERNLEVLEDRCLLSFSPAVSYSVGTNPQAVVTADINHDGRLDLAVANVESDSVSVLLGNGNGSLQPARTFTTGAR